MGEQCFGKVIFVIICFCNFEFIFKTLLNNLEFNLKPACKEVLLQANGRAGM